MLPLENAGRFVDRLVQFAPDVLVIQHFHDSKGCFGADTGAAARRLLNERHWTEVDYRGVKEKLKQRMTIYEGEEGFFPPG
jgi:hypothetical protein